jgi:hypothetical protein
VRGYVSGNVPRRDSLPSVKKSPINQRLSEFWEQNRCVFLFGQSGCEETDLPPWGSSGDRDNTIWRNGIIRSLYRERTIEKKEISESWNSLEKLLQLSDFFYDG